MNTKLLSDKGDYRLTFMLEGSEADGGKCPNLLNTVFGGTTKSVNVGERRPATALSAAEMKGTHGESGLVYVDVAIGASGSRGSSSGTTAPQGGGAVMTRRAAAWRVLARAEETLPRSLPAARIPDNPFQGKTGGTS